MSQWTLGRSGSCHLWAEEVESGRAFPKIRGRKAELEGLLRMEPQYFRSLSFRCLQKRKLSTSTLGSNLNKKLTLNLPNHREFRLFVMTTTVNYPDCKMIYSELQTKLFTGDLFISNKIIEINCPKSENWLNKLWHMT